MSDENENLRFLLNAAWDENDRLDAEVRQLRTELGDLEWSLKEMTVARNNWRKSALHGIQEGEA